MARRSVIGDHEILQFALVGLESQHNRIDEAIRGIRSRLGIRGPVRPAMSIDAAAPDGAQSAPIKRKISAAARKRIGEATRKRWAALRKAKAAPMKAEKPKRKMSAAGKARIVAATKKRWAAFHKEQKAAAKKTTPKRTAKKAGAKGRKARVLAAITPILAPVMP